MGGRWRHVLVLLAVLALLAPLQSSAVAADPATVALDRLEHDTRSASGFGLAHTAGYTMPVSGRKLWAGKFIDQATGDVRVMYVDGATALTPAELAVREQAESASLSAFARKADAGLRAARDRGSDPVALSLWLDADPSSAVSEVIAHHPGITWRNDRPDVSDPTIARQLRQELYDARETVYAQVEARAATLVRSLGGTPGYASTSVPLLFATVPPLALDALAARPEVRSMGAADPGGWGETMAYAGPTVRADWAYAQGYRGSGVRVADVEYYNVQATGDLAGTVVAYHNTQGSSPVYDTSGLDHPSWVAGAVASQSSTWRGTAPSAGIVSSSTGGGSASLARDEAVIAATDWAIGSGQSDIVNTSLGQDTATGREEARTYFDSIVWEDSRVSVSSAGNHSTFGNWDIVSPGTGWNVITVGGTDDKSTTSWSDDQVWYTSTDGSCYNDPSGTAWNPHGDFNKPNVVAPAVSVRTANGWTASGTSVASPITAGLVAQLVGRNGTFVNWPEIPRALLMAGAIHHTAMPDGTVNVDHEGVGTVDAEWANRILDGSQYGGYSYGALTASGTTSAFSVAKGQNVRVALVWDSRTSGSNLSKTDTLTADLDLRVTFPDGVTKSSLTFDNNYEFIEYSPTVSGTATIKVGATRFDASSEDYALAWVKWPTASDTNPPTAPKNLVAAATGPTGIRLSWSPSTDDIGVAGYRISRNGTQIATLTATNPAADAKNVNPGTYINSPTLGVTGALSADPDTAVTFDGATQYVRAGSASTAAALSLEVWAKTSGWITNSALGGQWAVTGAMLYVLDSTHIGLYLNDTYTIVAAAPSTGAWHHIVGTFDGSQGRLYVDGSLVAGPVSRSAISLPNVHFELGTYNEATGKRFGGTLDEVAWYNRALSATEVADHHALGTGNGGSYASSILGTSGLVSYWRLGDSGSIAWADQGLTPSTAYTYSVVAFDAAGNVSPAATASATTAADTTAPSTPGSLTATPTSTSTVALSWSPSSDDVGVAGYRISRDGTQIATVTGSSYADGGLLPATTYHYSVVAFDLAGNVSAPATASATTFAQDTTAPTAPTNLTATVMKSGVTKLTWTASTDNVGVAGYHVYRNGALYATTTGTSLSIRKERGTFTYWVVAFDAAANVSDPSNSVTVTV